MQKSFHLTRRFGYVLLSALFLVLAGCTNHTDFGPCVGLGDDKNPALEYKVSAWNVAMGVIFIELVAPPIFVVVDETFCPVGKKPSR
jgi:hypothetical protein